MLGVFQKGWLSLPRLRQQERSLASLPGDPSEGPEKRPTKTKQSEKHK